MRTFLVRAAASEVVRAGRRVIIDLIWLLVASNAISIRHFSYLPSLPTTFNITSNIHSLHPCSLHPALCSQLPACCSQLLAGCSPLAARCSLFLVPCTLLPTPYFLLPALSSLGSSTHLTNNATSSYANRVCFHVVDNRSNHR